EGDPLLTVADVEGPALALQLRPVGDRVVAPRRRVPEPGAGRGGAEVVPCRVALGAGLEDLHHGASRGSTSEALGPGAPGRARLRTSSRSWAGRITVRSVTATKAAPPASVPRRSVGQSASGKASTAATAATRA